MARMANLHLLLPIRFCKEMLKQLYFKMFQNPFT